MSAHTAEAITVVDDPAGTPFKLANIGGVAGTLDQDRLTAVRARLDESPTATPITSHVSSGDRSRTGTCSPTWTWSSTGLSCPAPRRSAGR
ncbi:MAG: hypothetical protein GEV03_03885 [Streptosporangiales bacterium]|nr:hypothetical protein [Streptosporangiales bacterium]